MNERDIIAEEGRLLDRLVKLAAQKPLLTSRDIDNILLGGSHSGIPEFV